jgi:hypothetical protein
MINATPITNDSNAMKMIKISLMRLVVEISVVARKYTAAMTAARRITPPTMILIINLRWLFWLFLAAGEVGEGRALIGDVFSSIGKSIIA